MDRDNIPGTVSGGRSNYSIGRVKIRAPNMLLPADHLPGAGGRVSRRWHRSGWNPLPQGTTGGSLTWGGNPRGREKDPLS